MGAMSSYGHVDPLVERFASWIGQQDSTFPVPQTAGGLEPRQVRRNVSVGSSRHGPLQARVKTAGVRLLVSRMSPGNLTGV